MNEGYTRVELLNKLKKISIAIFVIIVLGLVANALYSCGKLENKIPPTCIMEELPDTLIAGESFIVDATQSLSYGEYELNSIMVQSLNAPIVTKNVSGLKTNFIVHEKGYNTIRVTVFERYRCYSGNVKQIIYFK